MTTTGPPRVSLILLSYDYARYVGRTIESVLAQTFADWELVVVDDGSHDDSVDVVRGYDDPRISLHASPVNQGAAASYNRGLALCRGEYVGSVDADDALDPRRLERQVAFMDERPDLDATGTWVTVVDGEGRHLPGRIEDWVNQPRDLSRLDSWSFLDPLCHSSVLLRREAHLRVGGLDPDLSLALDFDLWARGLVHGLRFGLVHERLTAYRVHGANVSARLDPRLFFLELAFVFARRLAPLAVRQGRRDLVARGLRYFTDSLVGASVALRLRLHRLLAAFAVYPDRFPAFRAAFADAAGDDWPRLMTAIEATAAARAGAAAEPAGPAAEPVPAPPPARRAPALVVVDDFFPDLLTGFRVEELDHYLAELDCEVCSTHRDFPRAWEAYRRARPAHADRVVAFDPARLAGCSLLYFVFLGNAHAHLPLVERLGVPFVFTLYPGGGLELHDPIADLRLQEVCRSPLLRRVIVNQEVTRRYLVRRGLCPPEKVELVYGCPLPVDLYRRETPPRRRYPEEKPTFDVCFVAFKYTERGADKGYPTFVAAARELARRADDVRFHVVGGMTRDDVPTGDLGDRITFHPPRPASFFPGFYAGMDVILSPNVPYTLLPGAFDGFPTACCSEASLAGVAVFASDVLGENRLGRWFRPDEEIAIVEPDAAAIVPRLLAARRDPAAHYRMAAAGQARTRLLFAAEAQLAPRLRILRDAIDEAVARREAAA